MRGRTLARAAAVALALLSLSSGFLFAAAAAEQVTSLDKGPWTLSNGQGVSLPVSLPKYALEAMQDSGLVGDPLWRFNEREYRYVAEQVWTFERSFDVDAATTLSHAAVDLVITGLDTVADVLLNGEKIARCENAHREHRLPVKDLLKPGTNTLAIRIQPAILEAFKRSAAYPYAVPYLELQSVAPYNFIRKPASDFGWDWGPAFAPSGIYGSVKVVAYSSGLLTGAGIRQQHHAVAVDGSASSAPPSSSDAVTLHFDAYIEAPTAGEKGTLTIRGPEGKGWDATAAVRLPAQGLNVVPLAVAVPAGTFDLWWPVGYGAQPLYGFNVTYAKDGEAAESAASTPLARRVGFRTVELRREPLHNGQEGSESFFFAVNGVPVYAKGTNMIPLDIFSSKTTPADLRFLVKQTVDANMNMLRVWGGGLYPHDALYDACDESGVLLWQEAMFACSMYPRDPRFLAEVSKEVAYQARRLNWHASLAIWGGNNEVETAMGWYEPSRNNKDLYANDYSALFVNTVRAALQGVSSDVIFVDSSPSKGALVNTPDMYVKKWGDAGNSKSGDVHFYTTVDNALNTSTFPRAKFVSEFGFQSFPSWQAVKKYSEPQDWSYLSPLSTFLQRHPGDTEDMMKQMESHYQVPPAYAPAGAPPAEQSTLFQKWIYLTQVYQAATYDAASTYWRRIKTEPDAQTMGVLYWQLNDIWAGFSWSSLDFGGNWKLLHYSVKRFFAPVLCSGSADAWVNAYVTSDVPTPVAGELKVEVIDWAAEGPDAKPLWSETKAYALGALDSKKLWWKRVDRLLRDAGGVDASRAFVRISAKAASVGDGAAAAAAIARTNAAIEAMLAKDALAVSLEDQRGAAAEEVAAAEAAAAVVSSAAASASKTASAASATSSASAAASSSSSSLTPAAKAAVDALISHAAAKGGSLPPEMLTQSFLAKASRKAAAASAAVAEAAEKSDRAAANELRLAARDAAVAAADAAMSASVDGPDADAAALAAAAASIAAYEAKQNSNNLTAPPPADVPVGAPAPSPAKAPSPPPSAPLPPRLVALMSPSEARAAAAKGARPPAADPPSGGSGWASSSFIWLTEPKAAAINPRPRLSASDFVQVSPSTVSFKLSSKGVAPYVALDTSFDGTFDDNNLLMVPWEPRTLTFTGRGGAAVDAAAFAKSLGVLSLADTLDKVSTIYLKPSSVN